jgi:rRNA processing protein Krr1/Pno1
MNSEILKNQLGQVLKILELLAPVRAMQLSVDIVKVLGRTFAHPEVLKILEEKYNQKNSL